MQLDRLSVDTTQRTCMTKARQIGGLPPSEKTGSGLGRPFATVRFGSASVPIYVGKVKGVTRYTASFYLNGRRVRRTFSTLEKAKQEARLIALSLIYTLLFILAVVAVVMVGGIAAGLFGLAGAGPLFGGLFGFGLSGLLVYVAVRMSLGPVITFSEDRLAIFDSWRMTQGLFWPMFGTYLLAIIAILIFYLLSMVLVAALGAILSGGDIAAVGKVMTPDMSSLKAYFSPGQILMILFSAFMSAIYNAVMSAPAAVIYRGIRARRSAI